MSQTQTPCQREREREEGEGEKKRVGGREGGEREKESDRKKGREGGREREREGGSQSNTPHATRICHTCFSSPLFHLGFSSPCSRPLNQTAQNTASWILQQLRERERERERERRGGDVT